MLTVVTFLSMFIGYEGYDNGKIYVIYTQTTEYGYVITDKEIYLDTVTRKDIDVQPKPSGWNRITASEKRLKFYLTR